MISSADVAGKQVRTTDGRLLGHVHEIRIQNGKVTHLICGARGLFQRLTRSRKGRRIRWQRVIRISPEAIIIDDA
jgi:sporulation protein YlmC with PRC-barrel domain